MKLDRKLHTYRLGDDVVAQHDRREGKGWKVVRIGFDPKSEWIDGGGMILDFKSIYRLAKLCSHIEKSWKRKAAK